jgi:hypothetical protein
VRHLPLLDQFWSFIVYDSGSRSMMETSQRFLAISSYDQAEANPDGSIDLYIGPKAPQGKERNWIETDPKKGWTGIFRVDGPLQPFFDQTWKLDHLEARPYRGDPVRGVGRAARAQLDRGCAMASASRRAPLLRSSRPPWRFTALCRLLLP